MGQSVTRRRQSLSWLRLILLLIGSFVCFVLAYVLYIHSASFHDVTVLRSQVYRVILPYASSLTLLILSFGAFVYLFVRQSSRSWIGLSVVSLFFLSTLYLVWQFDQNFPLGEKFRYGYFSSRLYLFIVFGVPCLAAFAIGVFYLWSFVLNCAFGRRKRLSFFRRLSSCFVIVVFLPLFLLAVSLLVNYHSRSDFWHRGLFDEFYVPGVDSMCYTDDTTYLPVTQHKPRVIFQYILFTYWCRKTPRFTFVQPIDWNHPEIVRVSIECPRRNDVKVKLFPRLSPDYYTLGDLGPAPTTFDSWHISLLPFSMEEKSILMEVGEKRDQDGRFQIEYDGMAFGLAKIECGDEGNLVQVPRRRKDSPVLSNAEKSNSRPNVLILWMDSVARKTFEMNYYSIIRVLEEMRNEKTEPNNPSIVTPSVIQFFQHRTVGYLTIGQITALMNGQAWAVNRSLTLFEAASSQGYETLWASTLCADHVASYNQNWPMTDYVQTETSCLPEYFDPDIPYQFFKGPVSAARRCLYQKEVLEYALDYTEEFFLETFPDKPKWAIVELIEPHDISDESGFCLDKPIAKFLRRFWTEGMFENTIVAVMGDHGNHVGFLPSVTKEGRHLHNNPFLALLIPPSMETETVRVNSRRLVTMHDLHRTMWEEMGIPMPGPEDFPENENKLPVAWKEGVSFNVMRDEVPWDRNCRDLKVGSDLDAGKAFPVCDTLVCMEDEKAMPWEFEMGEGKMK